MQPVFRTILAQAKANPDKPAMRGDDFAISYHELSTRILSTAEALSKQHGISTGDRVVILARSHEDFVYTYFANHCLGGVNVPLDPRTSSQRLEEIVDRVTPRLVVSASPLPVSLDQAILFSDLKSDSAFTLKPSNEDCKVRTADILFTTGTSGRAKGVVLSHRALAAAATHINEFIGLNAHAVEVLSLPLCHSFGLGRLRCVLSKGATVVLLDGLVNTGKIVDAISNFAATGFASVPTGIAILMNDEDLAQFARQLEYIEIGSSRMPLARKKELMNLLPHTRLCMHYGLTEASRSAFVSFHEISDRLESIGKPSPRVEMRVVDDYGKAVPEGTDGQIEVRGAHLMTEYWQDPTLTSATLRDGWLRTGDVGRHDSEGFYYLSARSGDLINVGGRKVSPTEIEEILTRHPAIAECACVGVPDPQGLTEEIISVFMVADPSAGQPPKFTVLAKLLRETLEPYKIPRRFTWVETLPRSSSGKILRRNLRLPDD